MLSRFLGVLSGLTLILFVLHRRGLPVLILLKAIPLLLIVGAGILLIVAGLSKD